MMYAEHASSGFNARFHTILNRLGMEVQNVLQGNLVALILGGGYGRGEGGIIRKDELEHPYNDIDLTLVVNKKRDVSQTQLTPIRTAFEKELHIDVDFSRPVTIQDVRRWPAYLMWYDLLRGHHVLWGQQDILEKNVPSRLQQPLPAIEATRLLLNRGAGVLWAMLILRGYTTAPDGDFIRRNYYKSLLALGDALLISYGRYVPSYRQRESQYINLCRDYPNINAYALSEKYRKALTFRKRPDDIAKTGITHEVLQDLTVCWIVIYLHIESRRTGKTWTTSDEYTQWCGLREPAQHTLVCWPRNIIRNLQAGRVSWRYPREELYRTLPKLLAQPDVRNPRWVLQSEMFLKKWRRWN